MATLCNLPTFSFTLSLPIQIPSLPDLTIPVFVFSLNLFCPLDR